MHDSAFEGVLPQALLYLANELGPEEARAFEEQLGTNPAAQDALCQAVRLTQEPTEATPHPRYLRRVRRRLRRSRTVPRRAKRRLFLVGAGLGLLVLLILCADLRRPPAECAIPRNPVKAKPTAETQLAVALSWARFTEPDAVRLSRELRREAARPPQAQAEPAPALENVWATINTTTHLERAHDELRRHAARKRDLGPRGTALADRKHL